ncbi:MAG: hypothetical protein V6Z86_06015 [Hyphomicrobiales bacterium]
MAKYTITHSDGEIATYASGFAGEAEFRPTLTWLADQPGPAAWQAAREAALARQDAQCARHQDHAARMSEYGLPELVGSPKQVAWAEAIRADKYVVIRDTIDMTSDPAADGSWIDPKNGMYNWFAAARIRDMDSRFVELVQIKSYLDQNYPDGYDHAQEMAALRNFADARLHETSAKWWIDHRYDRMDGWHMHYECLFKRRRQSAMNRRRLPELVGSPKQIAWAEAIRADKFDDLNVELNHAERPTSGEAAHIADLHQWLVRGKLYETSAKWWIDHRDDRMDGRGLIRDYNDFLAELKNPQ